MNFSGKVHKVHRFKDKVHCDHPKILVVDDDAFNVIVFKRILDRIGH